MRNWAPWSFQLPLGEEIVDDDECWFIVFLENGISIRYRCSKRVIANASTFFRSMFESVPAKSCRCVVTIDDIVPELFEKFLQYIFYDNTNLTESLSDYELIQLAIFGDRYSIDSLVDHICDCLNETNLYMETEDLVYVLELADMFKFGLLISRTGAELARRTLYEEELKDKDIYVCNTDCYEIYINALRHGMDAERLFELIERYWIKYTNEKKAEAADLTLLDDYRKRLIEYVNFRALSLSYFYKRVSVSPLMTPKDKFEKLLSTVTIKPRRPKFRRPRKKQPA